MRIEIKWKKFFSLRLILGDDYRNRGHAAFDPIWQDGHMSRNAAYKWLAEQLGITRSQCHFSAFDKKRCEEVISICNEFLDGTASLSKKCPQCGRYTKGCRCDMYTPGHGF